MLLMANLAMVNVVLEVMVLDADVLCVWPDLWKNGNLNCSTVVFKNLAVDSHLGAAKPKT